MITYDKIPKLISCNACETVDLEYIPHCLEHYNDEYGLDLNPDFQRGHVWNLEQKEKFIKYIIRGGKTNPIYFNSPEFGGYDIEPNCDLSSEIVIVDGKQRLNAIQEFLDNKVKVFGYLLNEFSLEDQRKLKLRTSVTFSVNRLQTRKELLTWYLEMNEGHIAHSQEELDRVKQLLNKVN